MKNRLAGTVRPAPLTRIPGRCRHYLAIFSPGILLVRYEMLRLVRAAAELGVAEAGGSAAGVQSSIS